MSIEQQVELLMKTFPALKKATLRALSESGIIWVNVNTGKCYKVENGKAERL